MRECTHSTGNCPCGAPDPDEIDAIEAENEAYEEECERWIAMDAAFAALLNDTELDETPIDEREAA